MASVEVWASRHTLGAGFVQVVVLDWAGVVTIVFPSVTFQVSRRGHSGAPRPRF